MIKALDKVRKISFPVAPENRVERPPPQRKANPSKSRTPAQLFYLYSGQMVHVRDGGFPPTEDFTTTVKVGPSMLPGEQQH